MHGKAIAFSYENRLTSAGARFYIGITHFGRICKYLDKKQPHPKVRLEIR